MAFYQPEYQYDDELWEMTTHSNSQQQEEDGGYDYEFIKPGPSEDCICAICHLVPRNAHQSSCCGKIFCEVCINRLKKSNLFVNCPNCRQDFHYFKDIRTNREIESLKIYCTNHSKGCLWVDELNKVEEHIKTCPYQIIECEKKCEQKIQRQLMKAHLANECPNRNAKCIDCNEIGTWVFINGNHFDVCPDLLLQCSNAGCEEQVKRRNLDTHQETCPKRVVPCPFMNVGCTLTFKNEDITKHKQEHVEKHLSLAVEKIEKLEIQQQKQQIAPLVLKIEKFDESNPVRSQPFYTSSGGYKMSLLVKPNGFQEHGKTWVSCAIDLMPGEYDDTLEWPFQGQITVELLNQLQNNNHRQHTINYPEITLQDVCTVQDEVYQYYGFEYGENMNYYQHTEQAVGNSNKKNEQQYGKIEEISQFISHDDLGLESVSLIQNKAIPTSSNPSNTCSLFQSEAIPTSSMPVRHYTTRTSCKPTYTYPNVYYESEYEREEIFSSANVQFLVNGTLYLRVNVQTHSQNKPWLCTYMCSY